MNLSSMSISEPISLLAVATPHSSDSSQSRTPYTNICKMGRRKILVISWLDKLFLTIDVFKIQSTYVNK
jgi:hypothetical protein